jgi:hypothetical protein
MKDNPKIRAYVFAREQNICRCCRIRRSESMHELHFRSLGGKVSKRNSVAVCGDGVRGCHGFLQRNEIAWQGESLGAEGLLMFHPKTAPSAEWMRVKLLHRICSMPGGHQEEMPA